MVFELEQKIVFCVAWSFAMGVLSHAECFVIWLGNLGRDEDIDIAGQRLSLQI